MRIEGHVTDKTKAPIANALIEVKGEDFDTLFSTESDETGCYALEIPAGQYPFLTAVKDYGTNCLEYWCQNISLQSDLSLDMSIDKLELYGLHVFAVKGAGDSLMAYFRPMSLPKFQQGLQDIAPEGMVIRVSIDGRETPVIHVNPVREFAGGRELSACLIQVDTGESNMPWRRFDLQVTDAEGHYGAATIFNHEVNFTS